MKNAKNLRTESDMDIRKNNLNPELTEAERSIEKQLRDERNKRNAQLPNLDLKGRLRYSKDKKYYWGIRGGQLRQITMAK